MRKSEVGARAGSLEEVFQSLRSVLQKHAATLVVSEDTSTKYCLDAPIGPATLQAWGGKARSARIPVAWVEVGKSYVSYHLMGIAVPSVQSGMTKTLKARMQGKTCFNFTIADPALLTELDSLTVASITAFKKAGFTA
jgi:hypothetical protein